MIFANAIFNKKELKVYNYGKNFRDFTYIDDVISAILALLNKPAKPNLNFDKMKPEQASSWSPYKIYNIGSNRTISVLKFIELIEEEIGIKANKVMYPMQPGDVVETYADTSSLEKVLENSHKTDIKDGIKHFINWYKLFYSL
jgi:UDP-glucuronate 4-epimerase